MLREAGRRPRLVDALTRPRAAEGVDADHPTALLATGVNLPVAALTRRRDYPDDADGIWLRADPIGLTPDLAAVWLQADQRFEPGDWQAALEALMAEEGYRLEFHSSGRGYLRLPSHPDCRFVPPRLLAGNSLEYCLPEGPEARRWRRLLNETQVLLHQQGAGDPRVPGSLWFWGGGALPSAGDLQPGVRRIVGHDAVAEGLAHWMGLDHHSTDEAAAIGGGTLQVWPVDFGASADDNLAHLGLDLRRAWRALRSGRIGEFELAGNEARWCYRPLDAWTVWR